MKAFECKQCGECCYGEGGIFVDPDEIKKQARFLGLEMDAYISKYCEKRKRGYYITVGDDGNCIFFKKGKGCIIHQVKPSICSLWPFFPANVRDEESWEMAKEACPGIIPESSFEDFLREAEKNRFGRESSASIKGMAEKKRRDRRQ